jgi:hypothetical protein
MALYKTGLANSTKGSSSPSSTSGEYQGQITDLKSQIVAARVTDIVLDENHPKWDIVGEWNGIGAIFYEFVNQSATGTATNYALPYDAQSKTYPLVNEIVLLFSLPDSSMGRSTDSKSYFYLKPLGIWNHPHHDAYPNPTTYGRKQKRDYDATDKGVVVRQVKDNENFDDIDLNSPINPSQNTFVEKVDIHPLMPFMGDSLLEGRYGQSLRFGSTAKSQSEKKNNWSSAGNNGDPITILRNGQPTKVSPEGWIPITENITQDLSSVYLTSYQKIPFSIANEKFRSYPEGKEPKSPSEYTFPQIILNSNRIVLNAKTDSILISGEKSVGISSNGSVNIESTSEINLASKLVRLGGVEAEQSVLLGDETVELLKNLVNEVSNLATALQTIKMWPGGAPTPDPTINPVAKLANTNLKNIRNKLDSIKSKTVKTL